VFGSAENQRLSAILVQEMHDKIALALRRNRMRAMRNF
jgi:hypothetical protein